MKLIKKVTLLAATATLITTMFAHAEYPNKTINLIVPFSAGGGTDTVARKLANLVSKDLGKTIIVINKTGGAGAIGMTEGARARKDGYTLTMITREIVSLPLLGLSAVTSKNFDLIAMANNDPAIITVNKDSKYKTIKDLIDDAKAHPGQIKFASTAQPNFYALTLQYDQGVTFNQIPFNGAGEAIPAVLGGHADFTMTGPGEIKAQLDGGALRSLGVLSPERVPGFDVPTLKEQGMNVFSSSWRGVAVPKGTDPAIVEKLRTAFGKAIQSSDFNNFMNNAGFKVQYMNGPEFTSFIAGDTKTLAAVMATVKK